MTANEYESSSENDTNVVPVSFVQKYLRNQVEGGSKTPRAEFGSFSNLIASSHIPISNRVALDKQRTGTREACQIHIRAKKR